MLPGLLEPQLGHALGPDPGGNFCFYFLSVLLGTDSIHLGLSGRFGRYIYILFFSVVVAVLFPRGRRPVLGQGRLSSPNFPWPCWINSLILLLD